MGITTIERVITGNALVYRRGRARRHALTDLGVQDRLPDSCRPGLIWIHLA
ncbi:hypothetical protein [Phytohabitans houttuyneae]|uniref:hypothetical protein n=1 Tax=Phytohabitans houttuyneae TaxID=1076126 RepID=UPI001FE65901|nr:hypothetical protein [Phytohabitans houttuyneae]